MVHCFCISLRCPYANADRHGCTENLFGLVDAIADERRGYCIAGKRNQAVLLSMEDWKAIEETLYLHSIPGMAKSIVKGMQTPVEKCATEIAW